MLYQFSKFFNDFVSEQKFDQFCKAIENFLNQDDIGLKKFVFECFDTMKNDKITDESLFKFMNIAS